MKSVFVATEKDDVRGSALAFIVANIYYIVQGFAGFETVSYTHLTLPTKA